MDSKKDIKSLNLEELKTELESMGEKAFRAKQMYEWMHVKLARSFDEMTNLSAKFREQCKEKYEYTCVKPVRIQESKIDGTKKFLFELSDGNVVESVWMQYKHGNSVCISSQVGCRMGCRFCASTLDGLERNLTPSEMLDQIYAITRLTQERVSNVVVMGTGEPMDNYDNILKFLHLLTDENGLNISQRNVTVSTCGIVPRMRQLADEKLQITLALSLHATTDEKRRKLMPIANRYSIKELMEVCQYYFEQTGRRITFEYSLVGGVNDTEEDAIRMANNTEYGLSSYIWSNDVSQVCRMSRGLQFGIVNVNGPGTGPAVPHGGCKNSGIGKDGSRYSLEEYTYIKGIRMAIS